MAEGICSFDNRGVPMWLFSCAFSSILLLQNLFLWRALQY